MTNCRKRQRGFSLIELLVVVAIILIISAIAIPRLLAARKSANEVAAANQVRTVLTAEQMFGNDNTGNWGFLADLGTAGVIDAGLGCAGATSATAPCTRQGYDYTVDKQSRWITAVPHTPGNGSKVFCADAGGTIYFDGSSSASATTCQAFLTNYTSNPPTVPGTPPTSANILGN